MNINGREIGLNHPPYIVAEISGEHKGKLINALRLINAAKEAGADAVKFQIYDPVLLATMRGGLDHVLTEGPWAGLTLEKLYMQTYTPREWLPELVDYCSQQEITWFTSVFHEEDLENLEKLGCPAYKIASPEISKKKLISACKKTNKPLIVSLGHASDGDIESLEYLTDNLIVLHCVSKYPCPIEQAELMRLQDIVNDHNVWVGYSDHTTGIIAPVVATALGAVMIEKHITLSNELGGWDKDFSLEPQMFGLMVDAVREAYTALTGVTLDEPADPESE